MSGGRFDYKDIALKDEIFGYGDKFTDVFEDREISKLVLDVLDLIHEYDWYASGDTSEEQYITAKTAFKKKWLQSPPEDRVKTTIDEVMEEVRHELYKTYGVETGVMDG